MYALNFQFRREHMYEQDKYKNKNNNEQNSSNNHVTHFCVIIKKRKFKPMVGSNNKSNSCRSAKYINNINHSNNNIKKCFIFVHNLEVDGTHWQRSSLHPATQRPLGTSSRTHILHSRKKLWVNSDNYSKQTIKRLGTLFQKSKLGIISHPVAPRRK